MTNTLLLIAAAALLLAIVRIRAYDAGRKVGQREGFFYAIQMATLAADSETEEQREYEQRAAEVAPWN